jgi:hypothetical protein
MLGAPWETSESIMESPPSTHFPALRPVRAADRVFTCQSAGSAVTVARTMICFSRDFVLGRRRFHIRLRQPMSMILFTGCDKERINAVFDRQNRLLQLVVHTRQKNVR